MTYSQHAAVSTARRDEMLDINTAQRRYYERPRSSRGNGITSAWRNAREAMTRARDVIDVTNFVQQKHRKWLGDLNGMRVLDLGCYSGNDLSLEIAANCGSYLGVDLSEPAISRLDQKLRAKGLDHAKVRSVDFLSPEFDEDSFDVIYAYSVMHHFKYFEVFLKLLRQRLVPGGRVISFDAMETSWPVWLARRAYRPFQSDADWEYPFSRESFRLIDKYFHIEAVQGIMGLAKWSVPLVFVPGGDRAAHRLHAHDMRNATRRDRGLWRCMQVALLLRRRDEPLGTDDASVAQEACLSA